MQNSNTQLLTVKEAAEKLQLNPLTIRRRIKEGKLKASLIEGKFGKTYMVEVPLEAGDHDLDLKRLMDRIEVLNQEVGYYKGLAEGLQAQVKQLTAPKLPWYKTWWPFRR